MYTFHALDPRDIAGGLAYLTDRPALGLEVTVPALAEACSLGNLDPQHLGGNAQVAAIEVAADRHECPLPPSGTALVTVRADADSLGAMAILALRAEGHSTAGGALAARVGQIATADKEASGPWPGLRPVDDPRDLLRPTAVVEALCMQHGVPLEERVMLVRQWLVSGNVDGGGAIAARLLGEAEDAIASLEVRVVGGVALVDGPSRLGLQVGYRHAPVVVHCNPAFSWQGGEPHRKHTVARWNTSQPMDWAGMLKELQALEPGWGGSTSICGSPQGQHSSLSGEQVAEIVNRHLG